MSRTMGDVMEAPDVLQKLGRPGFPQGLKVLLVGGGYQEECKEIEEQMRKLCYSVTCCQSCSEARLQLAEANSSTFDILLAEASVVSKDAEDRAQIMEIATNMPLVLFSSTVGMTESVWRGIEIGAAEVLEKPLSTHKLQNIWQHVVRRVLDGKDTCQIQQSPFISTEKGDHESLRSIRSRKTRSSNQSTQDERIHMDFDGSLSGSPEPSVDASMSNTSPSESYTVESTANDSHTKMDWSPSTRAKRSNENAGCSNAIQKRKAPRAGLRTMHSTPLTNQVRHAQTVVGMVHPSWANQADKGSIPPGCVWGTPLNPPPGWPGPQTSKSPGPLLGSAANNTSLPRYNSAPICKLEPLSGLDSFDPLGDLDSTFNLGDDFMLAGDLLDCEDSFLSSLTDDSFTIVPSAAPRDYGLEAPPIGLSLKKSDSLLDLINSHLARVKSPA